jgi:hypothetical protein
MAVRECAAKCLTSISVTWYSAITSNAACEAAKRQKHIKTTKETLDRWRGLFGVLEKINVS